jgi:hypothetical protein
MNVSLELKRKIRTSSLILVVEVCSYIDDTVLLGSRLKIRNTFVEKNYM